MTCCCVSEQVDLIALAQQEADQQKAVEAVIQGWRTTEAGAVELAALLFEKRPQSGPVRVGIFATSNSTREASGAGYYGNQNLSGNLAEMVISVARPEGRAFTDVYGDVVKEILA